MEARYGKIENWFAIIKQGQVVLPRFQRHDTWRQAQIVGLLEIALRDPPPPIGALLTLESIPNEAIVADDYDSFLVARPERIEADMVALCGGAIPA